MQRRLLACAMLPNLHLVGVCALTVLAFSGPPGSAQEQAPQSHAFFEIDGRAKRVVQFRPESLPKPPRSAAGVVRTATVPDLSNPRQTRRSGAAADTYQQPSIAELSAPSLELTFPASPRGATPGAAAETAEPKGLPLYRVGSRAANGLPVESWARPSELVAPRYRIAELKPPIAAASLDRQRAAENRPMLRPPTASRQGDRSGLSIQPVVDNSAWPPRGQAGSQPDANYHSLPGGLCNPLAMESAAWMGDIRFPLGDSPHYYELRLGSVLAGATKPANQGVPDQSGLDLLDTYSRWLLARGKCLVAKRHYERRLVIGRHQALSDLASSRFQSELADAHGKQVSAKLEIGVAQQDLLHTLLTGEYPAADMEVLPRLPAWLFEPRSGPPQAPAATQQRKVYQARRLAALRVVQLRSEELSRLELDPRQPDQYLACQDRLCRAEWELIRATLEGYIAGAEAGAAGVALPAKADPARLSRDTRVGQAY